MTCARTGPSTSHCWVPQGVGWRAWVPGGRGKWEPGAGGAGGHGSGGLLIGVSLVYLFPVSPEHLFAY